MRRLYYSCGKLAMELNTEPYYIDSITGLDGINNKITTAKAMDQDGYMITGESLEDRAITLSGCIRARSQEELEIYRLKLIKLFNPKIEGTIIYEYGGIERKIEVKTESGPKFSKGGTWRVQKYIASFTAVDPFFNDLIQHKVQAALWKGAFQFPLVIPTPEGVIMGYKDPSLIVNIYNSGDVETGMLIVFRARGTLTNPSLFNVNTRESIKIVKGMVAGEVITINTNFLKKKVLSKLNGIETNIMNYLDIANDADTFLQLHMGDNLFRYDADTGLDNLEVDIYYDNKYLGV
jgi:hypothetical protein